MAAHGPQAAVDDDLATRWAADAGIHEAWLNVDLGEPKTFNRAFLGEAYDRVQSFELQYKRGEEWVTVARGDKIGKELTLNFEPVTARVVRLNVLQAADGPTIWEFQLFPPRN
jgi:alpha-L-fucosidase